MDGQDIKEKAPSIQEGEGFLKMWGLQLELLEEYKKIENLPDIPWDLRLKDHQILLKGFLARVVEELGEAYESFLQEDWANFKIELADASHFLIESCIVSGIKLENFNITQAMKEDINTFSFSPRDAYTQWFWETTYYIQLARNALRNKEWKETQVMPDQTLFHRIMVEVVFVFFKGFSRVAIEIPGTNHIQRMKEQDIFDEYWKKNQINKFRIRSKY